MSIITESMTAEEHETEIANLIEEAWEAAADRYGSAFWGMVERGEITAADMRREALRIIGGVRAGS